MTAPPRLATHSGKFHADDVFAYVTLGLALGLSRPGVDHDLLRTRDPAIIAAADIVWDVGGTFSDEAKRFDHHQRGAPKREDGTPFSSAGLVWRVFGRDAVRALRPEASPETVESLAAIVERDIVRRIDVIDNGLAAPEDSLGLADWVDDFNPAWNSPSNGVAREEDAAFLAAADVVLSFLSRRMERAAAKVAAHDAVLRDHQASSDPRLLEMATGMPYKGPVFTAGLPVVYAIYPVPNGNWMVDAMPPEPGSYDQRLPLPEAWAGLRDGDLAAVSGIPDAVFVHPRRFVGAAGSRDGALAMARRALELGAEPALTGPSA